MISIHRIISIEERTEKIQELEVLAKISLLLVFPFLSWLSSLLAL